MKYEELWEAAKLAATLEVTATIMGLESVAYYLSMAGEELVRAAIEAGGEKGQEETELEEQIVV